MSSKARVIVLTVIFLALLGAVAYVYTDHEPEPTYSSDQDALNGAAPATLGKAPAAPASTTPPKAR